MHLQIFPFYVAFFCGMSAGIVFCAYHYVLDHLSDQLFSCVATFLLKSIQPTQRMYADANSNNIACDNYRIHFHKKASSFKQSISCINDSEPDTEYSSTSAKTEELAFVNFTSAHYPNNSSTNIVVFQLDIEMHFSDSTEVIE